MNEHPLVSIITPTFNRAHLLPRAINSVLNQTYKNFELVIVDDGSSDNTEEVVKSYDDERIVYFKHKRNKGVSAAQNTGFDLARGDYLCRLDSDDELLPEALELAVHKFIELSSEEIKIISFNDIDVETGRVSGIGRNEEGPIIYEDLLCGKVRGDFWGMMRKDYIGDNRLDERFVLGDWNFWLKRHRQSKGYYVPRVLYRAYRKHGSSRTMDYQGFLKYSSVIALGVRNKLEEFGDEMKATCPAHYGKTLAQLGYLQIMGDDKLAGRKTLAESFKYNFSVKYYGLYLLSFILSRNQMRALSLFYYRLLGYKGRIISSLGATGKLSSRIAVKRQSEHFT